VGNGAYSLVEWAHEDHLTLEANPNYHGAADVSIGTIEYPIIIEDATALAAFERGELDTSGYPSEELPRILEEMPEDFVRLPRPGTYYCGFNTQLAPTDNLNLRMALSSAVDRRAILDAVLELPWRIEACGVIPPEIPGFQACGEVGFDYDLDAAAEYLEAAMAEMGVEEAGDITLQLWFNRGNEEVIEAVEEQWETNLGVNVNVVNMEWGAYLETLDLCNN
jgi:oligopeptide transport system substrate-binding protein